MQDAISWISPAGLSRAMYANNYHWSASLAVFARVWLGLLLVVPLLLGLTELVMGLLYRHEPESCSSHTPLWLIVDGSAALLLTLLSIIDISRVAYLSTEDEAKFEAASPLLGKGSASAHLAKADSPAERTRRINAMGSYACMGAFVIFVVPLFRLLWALYGIDIVYKMGK